MSKRTTTLQLDILDAWLQGMNRKDIAAKLGCTTRTVDATKSDPEIKRQYYERCSNILEDLLPLANNKLRELITDPSVQASVQFAAASKVVDRYYIGESSENKDINIVVSYE